MVILTSQLLFESSGQRLLYSVVYDEDNDRFVRTCQRISAELVQDLGSNNPVIDIYDVVNLDYIDGFITDDELIDIFQMIEEDTNHDNHIIKSAKSFIKYYKRNSKIQSIIEE
jgi:hypothetical protein